LKTAWLLHQDIVKGGLLKLTLGTEPNKAFANASIE